MSELNVLRRQTKRYIDANPESITLMRGPRTPDGAGGVIKTPPTPLTAQTMRVIQQGQTAASVERRNSAGEVVRPQLTLLAEWNADVAEGDTFTWHGQVAEVVYVTDLKYELSCEVTLT